MSDSRFAARRAAFRALHADGCFLIPNPWDAGAACILAQLGFKALATTSSGFAWSRGLHDGDAALGEVLQNCRDIVAATPLPVNADFENGHATSSTELKANVKRCVDTGVAGLSIEDYTGRPHDPLYPLDIAVQRMKAARAAIDETGADVLLIGRAECFLHGHPDALAESIRRLKAYAEAGADCLYAPGLATLAQIDAVVQAVAPKPANMLVGSAAPFTLAELAAHGVRRVSVGGALAGVAWNAMLGAASQLAEGRFDAMATKLPHPEVQKFMHHREATP
ncbi:MAG: isocitrate lyase/phosphoenolpyruvate mutase family protein [Nevskiaceae bacterium]|nr:MAG: isocitrate lyase/phosphoenolpyruvate mutase family protein [Nevskiaceae bacterium]TBR73524.1 MAG: isocitrate lyase/phosphoenolpyruvate mutase family protein [Nevskiaceae bacterium]